MLFLACFQKLAGRTLICTGFLWFFVIDTPKSSNAVFLRQSSNNNVIFGPATRFSAYKPSLDLPLTKPNDLILTGPGRMQALAQLQACVDTCMKLEIDGKGRVTFKWLRKPDRHHPDTNVQWLQTVINDRSVIVNISASDSQSTRDGRPTFGGAYLGNTFTGDSIRLTEDEFLKTAVVSTRQQVDPAITDTISEFYKKPGADMLHEVTESYAAAKYAQRYKGDDAKGQVYWKIAHDTATRQSGTIYERHLDSLGHPTVVRDSTFCVEYYVTDGIKEKVVKRLCKNKNQSQ